MRGLIVATQFLTRLPTPPLADWQDDDLARAAPWFPVVGLIIGVFVSGALWGGRLVSPEVAAVAALGVWVWATGALHLDGLADTADGLAAAHGNRKRFLDVARDPATGAFGVTAIVLALLAKFALLISWADVTLAGLVALSLIAAWARWIACCMAAVLPPLADGQAARFIAGIDRAQLTVAGAALAAASLWAAPVLVAAPLLAGAAIVYWRTHLGGISGDGFGATIEVCEVAMLAAVVIVMSAAL
ncbi:MAG: adenosylcobinamide-GDP ribazoletransferase [Pseudomonadota bacterium]